MGDNRNSLTIGLLAVVALLFVWGIPKAQAEGPRLITESVDANKLVTLGGNTRPEAQIKQYDRGSVPESLPMEHMFLQLRRSGEQERELEALIDDIQDKASSNFHHWLTAQEFGNRFGLAQEDRDTISRWLVSQGFTINVVYENGLLIDFSGTAGQVRQAFHTEIHRLSVKGAKHIANVSDPKIPAALAPAIVGIVSLNDFPPETMYRPKTDFTFTSNGYTYYDVVPSDLATIYNLNPLFKDGISGQGQTIVLLEDSNIYSTSDWTTFRSVFGLSSYTQGSLTQLQPKPSSGANNCLNPGANSDDGEASLDVEYASAAAPNAALEVASCADTTTFGGLIALQNLLNGTAAPPALMSMSYGECEAFSGAALNSAFNAAFQQAVTEGVSIFVSAGDATASGCSREQYYATTGIGVSGWASTPYNVAVGGTDFGDTYAGTNSTYWSPTNNTYYGSALSYVPEIPWNDSCASELIAEFSGNPITYGNDGFCNIGLGPGDGWIVAGGSGGPSGCATGLPSVPGTVGGTCAGWPKPSWQSLVGVPNDGVRDLPDVSLFSADGIWGHYYPFCLSDPSSGYTCSGTPDTWAGAGGTSFASPIMAGIQALVNQKAGERQGNPNYTYYSLANSQYGTAGESSCNSTLGNTVSNSCIFYDVTLGDIDTDCYGPNCYMPGGGEPSQGVVGVLSTSNSSYEPAYGTTTGWDFATGIGTVNATNLVNNWPQPSPNFSLVATPSAVTVIVGNNATSAITVIPRGGFSGNINFSLSGLPTGVTASFSQNPGTTSTALTLTVSATAAPQTATLNIRGTSGSLTNTASLNLTIIAGNPAFTLSATPSSVAIVAGVGSALSTIGINPVNAFSGNVLLTAAGLPKGVTASFGFNPAISSSAVTFTADSTAKTGTATVTIKGISGSLSASTTIALTVNPLGNFSVTASPKTLTIERGSAGSSTITIVPSNGFDQNVTLMASGLPTGVTASFSSSQTATASTLTLTVSNKAIAGKSAIAITGIYGSLSHEVLVTLDVTK